MSEFVAGRNAVLEVLRSKRSVNKLFVQQGAATGSVREIVALAYEKKIQVEEVAGSKLDDLVSDVKHQGVVVAVAPVDYASLEDALALAEQKGETPFLILLDNLQDPHNVGAIIRTVNIAGVHGVLLPKRRSCPLNQTVAKVSAGAVEHTPVVQIGNVAQTLDELKKKGFWVIGADMDGSENYFDTDLLGAIVLVIGSEGTGMGRLVKEKCDILVKIPMFGQINSLNASVACGILTFEIVRQRVLKARRAYVSGR